MISLEAYLPMDDDQQRGNTAKKVITTYEKLLQGSNPYTNLLYSYII